MINNIELLFVAQIFDLFKKENEIMMRVPVAVV